MLNNFIVAEVHGRVGVIRLNRPESLNALCDELMDQMGAALQRFDQDPGIGCVVLIGGDSAFAAGADIAAMKDFEYMDAYLGDYVTRNWECVRTFRKPIIAAVSGYALGGGCELAMACDFIIAGDDAVFGQPEIKVGILPGAGGTQRLPRFIGKAKAMALCLTGKTMSAAEAEAAGLVAWVVARDSLGDEVLAVARRIAGYSLPVAMMIKECVNRAFDAPLSEGLLFERRMFHAAFALSDQKEGMAAFLEKRKPEFQHR
ncbi:MAG: enoyl-CoA hydratase/carnithine racemase [Rhodocyclaceae bacterium]|nr:enoyl-CoA hydratase/carnithine racemase [Rhodocyclaceae bacterium]